MDANVENGRAEASAGEERVFDEQGEPVGPDALLDAPDSDAAGVAPATQNLEAGDAGDSLAREQPAEADEAEVALATPPSATTNYTKPNLTIAQLKEKIMATAPSNEDFRKTSDTINATVTDAMNEAQTRAKAAYEKGTEAVGELTDFAKGNVEAVVESSKIIAGGMQEIGRTYAEEAKAAYEQMTADLKELAAIKSPTELFQLQGKIMRRNFDMLVATSSKSSQAMMQLANEAFAPLSGRMNVAAEKISKVG